MAMDNGAVWVYSGLLDALSDDEMAIILGHELAHDTHEHGRRKMKQIVLAQTVANAVKYQVSSYPPASAK